MMLEQTNLTLPTTLQDVITRAASQHTQQNTQVVSIVLSFGFFASSWPERFIKLKKQRNRLIETGCKVKTPGNWEMRPVKTQLHIT